MFYFPNKPIRIYDCQAFIKTLSSDWIVQPKYDGKRVLMDVSVRGDVKLYGRQGQRFKESFPQLANLPYPKPFFLDGELMRDGTIACWDSAVWGSEEVWHFPYIERYLKLMPCQQSNVDNYFVVESKPIEQYKDVLSNVSKNIEGCVFKDTLAINLWGPNSTNETADSFKYRKR